MPSKCRVYCVVTCDLFHYGHVRFFKAARELGTELIVGICSDEDVARYKQPPIMKLEERAEVVEACRYVDGVIRNAPTYVSDYWIDKHDIDFVVAGEDYSDEVITTYFRHAKARGILRVVPYTKGISSSEIIRRCQGHQHKTLKSKKYRQDSQERYSRDRVLLSEQMYGKGYQTTGGEELAKKLARRLGIKEGDGVLDLGCGTGGTSLLFAKKYGASVTGVDLSSANIELCRHRAKNIENLRFIHGDVHTIEFQDKYELLWTRDVLLYIRDKVAVLRKIYKCLKPGRQSVVIDFCRGEDTSRQFEYYFYSCDYFLPTIEAYEEIIQAAGFNLVETVNFTDFSIQSMRADIARLQARKHSFLRTYSEDDFRYLIERWGRKIGFCQSGELQTAYFIFTKSSRESL